MNCTRATAMWQSDSKRPSSWSSVYYYGTSSSGGPINFDPEMGHVSSQGLGWDVDVRRGFVRKVFGILAAQLIVTAIFAIVVGTAPAVRAYCATSPAMLITASVLSFVVVIALSCSDHLRRSHPINLVMLGLFTLCEAYLVACIAAITPVEITITAVAITGLLCAVLVLYAMQTRYDFTAMGGALLVTLFGLLFCGILASFFPANRIVNIVYASIGAILFSCYLVYDVQILLSGKRMQLDPDEYVLAALSLYLDILNIFIFLLQLLQSSSDN